MSGGAQRVPDEPRPREAADSRGEGSASDPAAAAPTPGLPRRELDFEPLLPATAVDCRLRLAPADIMSSAVLTGLAMLARDGRIRLDVEIVPEAPPLEHGPWHLRDKQRPQTVLELDGGGSAVIDGHDSWEIETQDLLRHDLYFKRSLRPESMSMPRGERLRTLGLLNEVRADFVGRAELRSELGGARTATQRIRTLLRWAAWCGAARIGLGGRPNWSRMYSPPTPRQSQRVLLMAGLWDPAGVPVGETSQRLDRESINRQRVECIRALRRAFGARFHGGVRPSEFARRYAPDVMLGSERAASRREFLRQVREHAVCVTSHGLNGSNGFRLAEYVAFSRAIVCEPPRHVLPGGFALGENYLAYTTPDECVARVAWLFDRPDWREAMARRNWDWYCHWQRPDQLALRLVALTWAAGQQRRPTHGAAAERARPDQEPASALRAASS